MKRNFKHTNSTWNSVRKKSKGKLIEDLLDRSMLAIENEFYIESTLLNSMIIEDRIYSTLCKTIRNYDSIESNKKKTLGAKINDLLNEVAINDDLRNEIFVDLNESDIDFFREIRNSMAHNLINDDLIINIEDMKYVAEYTMKITKKFCASIMRWKSKYFCE
ncbi:MAG: hypothetical protein CVV57_01660 [Tenericutes bacterium HGW-Tenericutes-2]|jgi:hypothetical protein|nr:MAG: hypothetical protein CVV57_01660 [Tenericutes bacterium HGW-Tenericutes-2]